MRRIWLMVLAVLISVSLLSGQGTAEAATTTTSGAIDRTEGGTIAVSSDQSPDFEGKEKAFDNNPYTKWLVFSGTAWIQYQFAGSQTYAINSYSITAADDSPERDPLNWTLKASNDGTSWTTLDTRQNVDFDYRYKTLSFTFTNTTAYSYYKLELVNNSGSILQLAEIKLYDGTPYTTIHPTVTASGENAPNESKEKAVDGTSTTKWLTFQNSGWLQFDYGTPVTIDGYAITAANDAEERDPKQWILKGSNDGIQWTDIDTKTNENFIKRHQRNHYLLSHNTAYQYYKLELQNNSGSILQVGEVEFSLVNDIWHLVNPVVQVQNLDTAGNGYLFEQALPNPEQHVKAIVRKLVSILYANPGELPFHLQKIVIKIVDEPGVAWKSGSATEAHIGFSSGYLKSYYDSGQPLREEIIGILYHELTHAYQLDDSRYGEIGYMVEGMADAVRFEVGYHDRYHQQTLGGNWQGSYGVTGNFLRWISEHKHPGFLRDINASLSPFDGVNWTPDAFQTITGTPVNTLWNEYQGLDAQAPTAPTALASPSHTDTTVNLSWTASTDNVGVTGYDIYRDNVKIDSAAGTTYTATGLTAATAYSFAVKAKDAAGNVSAASTAITVTTNPTSSQTATIYYKRGFATPYIHYQVDGGSWTTAPGTAIAASEVNGYNKVTINLGSAAGLTAAFNNGSGTWDNNNGQNYRFTAGTWTFVGGTITQGVPQADSLTLVVTVPSNTPANADVYLASSLNSWTPNDASYKLTKNSNGTYSITLNIAASTSIQYKLTKGTWASVEVYSSGAERPNRTLTTTGGTQTVNLTVERWKDQ
ncbi:discoidin domain-containing protein [Paenibacillus oenotherae]|uniref:Discoidin domain-containing protein n=1 Tax=Paenibacillus oenotherae TaxID=1435645 RepID=A0ABS7D453_9BACL|nr:basic secretory protein-like protein [Paenibacillus oenotherae]MBW7474700.1 discoidin domain-containing protein [Paenibacillus oenotherae]